MPKPSQLFVNPLLAPLMLASATTIALRTMLMWPSSGRLSDWQRNEASRMVLEKAAAVQEAQVEALALAMGAALTPWTAWTTGGSASLAFEKAAGRILAPFSTRAARNARRLSARAMRPMLAATPILGAAPVLAAAPALAAAAPLLAAVKPATRPKKRPATSKRDAAPKRRRAGPG